MECLNLIDILKNLKTYPNWSTKTQYPIKYQLNNEKLTVFYEITKTPMIKKIERDFPHNIKLSNGLIWVMGFLRGEGLNSREKHSYKRFSFTNTNPLFIKKVLYELKNSSLLTYLPDGCIQILHSRQNKEEILKYWSKSLDLPKEKFSLIMDKNALKFSKYGVCHLYISDVLLRRVIDAINDYVFEK